MNAAPRCSTRMEYWVQGIPQKAPSGDLAARTGFGSARAFHRCRNPFGPARRSIWARYRRFSVGSLGLQHGGKGLCHEGRHPARARI